MAAADSKAQVGDLAPDVELLNSKGEKVTTHDLFSKHKYNVLFFYPGNFTPVCTKQCNLLARPDNWEALTKHDCGVFGVSMDDPESHEKFMAKYELPYQTFSDKNGAANTAFKVGRDFGFIKGRTTFLIGPDKRIHLRYNSQLQYGSHVSKTLETLEELTKKDDAAQPAAADAKDQ